LLRERINDIAAEIARLTMVLEGPGSPIEAILGSETAEPARAHANGSANGEAAGGSRHGDSPDSGRSLADRIRALQTRSARAPAN